MLKERKKEVISSNKYPSVDIIIPFHNEYDCLLKCLYGIALYTPDIKYRLFLIDDFSNNNKFLENLIKDKNRAYGIRNESQLGFAASVNKGIEISDSDFICVLHSDTFPNNIKWLHSLIDVYQDVKDDGIKLVSSKLNNLGTSSDYPKEILQSFVSEKKYSITNKPIPFISCLFHRQLIKSIGNLKEYPYAWFEDIEFYYRMKKHGYSQCVSNISYVEHTGSQTIKSVIKKKKSIRKIMEQNLNRCKEDIKNYGK